MNQTGFKKYITITALSLGIFLAASVNAPAFKGIGSEPSMNQQGPDLKEAKIEGHESNAGAIVATVNGAGITMGSLMDTMLEIIARGGYSGDSLTTELGKRIRHEALQELALEELAYQQAVSLGLTAKPALIEKKIEDMITQQGSKEAFEKTLTEQNKTMNDMRNEVDRFYSIRNVITEEVDNKAIVTDAEIDETYEINKDKFASPERVVVSAVIFFLDPEDTASKEKAESIRQKITDELDNNPAKLTPDGFVIESRINVSTENRADIYKIAKDMEPGVLSEPLVIDDTLHLLKLESYTPSIQQPEEESKAYIAQKLKSDLRQALLNQWRSGLTAKADIVLVHELLKDTAEGNAGTEDRGLRTED